MRRAILLGSLLLLIGTAPAFACAGKIVSSAAGAPLIYNPFAPLDAQQEIAIKVQNTGSDRCAYQLSIPDRYLPLQFTPNLRFTIAAGWGGRALLLQSRQFCSPVNLMTCALLYSFIEAKPPPGDGFAAYRLFPDPGRRPNGRG